MWGMTSLFYFLARSRSNFYWGLESFSFHRSYAFLNATVVFTFRTLSGILLQARAARSRNELFCRSVRARSRRRLTRTSSSPSTRIDVWDRVPGRFCSCSGISNQANLSTLLIPLRVLNVSMTSSRSRLSFNVSNPAFFSLSSYVKP